MVFSDGFLDFSLHWGPRLAAQGTSTHGAIDLSGGPMAPQVEVHCAASRGPWVQNENPKMLSFGRL